MRRPIWSAQPCASYEVRRSQFQYITKHNSGIKKPAMYYKALFFDQLKLQKDFRITSICEILRGIYLHQFRFQVAFDQKDFVLIG